MVGITLQRNAPESWSWLPFARLWMRPTSSQHALRLLDDRLPARRDDHLVLVALDRGGLPELVLSLARREREQSAGLTEALLRGSARNGVPARRATTYLSSGLQGHGTTVNDWSNNGKYKPTINWTNQSAGSDYSFSHQSINDQGIHDASQSSKASASPRPRSDPPGRPMEGTSSGPRTSSPARTVIVFALPGAYTPTCSYDPPAALQRAGAGAPLRRRRRDRGASP
jgi:hypothetical protein